MLQGKINIGAFDTKLVIQQNTPTQDSLTNTPVNSWATIATVFCKEDFGTTSGSSEFYEADQEVSKDTKIYTIRYSDTVKNINEQYRVSEDSGTTYYYVRSVDKSRRRGWIRIVAEKRDNQ